MPRYHIKDILPTITVGIDLNCCPVCSGLNLNIVGDLADSDAVPKCNRLAKITCLDCETSMATTIKESLLTMWQKRAAPECPCCGAVFVYTDPKVASCLACPLKVPYNALVKYKSDPRCQPVREL